MDTHREIKLLETLETNRASVCKQEKMNNNFENEICQLLRRGGQKNWILGSIPNLINCEISYEINPTAYTDELMTMLDVGATSSWWFETRNQVIWNQICRYPISGALWDIGSGLGEVSSYLTSVGAECVAVEPNRLGAQVSSEKGVLSIQGDLHALELPASSIEAVGLFDVLEHLDNADNVLSEIYRVLGSEGNLFLTVPATEWLWSASDDLAGHHLRYTRKKIR